MGYGTGAVMGVPAHDQRDFEFAQKYNLPLRVVITPPGQELTADALTEAYVDDGLLINSAQFTGETSEAAKKKIAAYLAANNWGEAKVTYRLRDWLISRQRYWGAPIPILYCEQCGTVPVPEEQLPVILPEDVTFQAGGQSPLAVHEEFLSAVCPQCGGQARRETDTMDTFSDSSWYYFRYAILIIASFPLPRQRVTPGFR